MEEQLTDKLSVFVRIPDGCPGYAVLMRTALRDVSYGRVRIPDSCPGYAVLMCTALRDVSYNRVRILGSYPGYAVRTYG